MSVLSAHRSAFTANFLKKFVDEDVTAMPCERTLKGKKEKGALKEPHFGTRLKSFGYKILFL